MDLKKYIYAHCIYPQKVWVYDTFAQQRVLREMPCGKCLHCRNTYVNEWCTRLFAQYLDSKYCYFVSLDYKPFDSSTVGRKLAVETAACLHNINMYHKYGLHPLILNKKHLQNFFKRLRKNTKVPLQYFACGEYGTHANGKGYGRPHFHIIVFSNDPLSSQDFLDAWTLNGYVIGRVDYEDMKACTITDKNLQKSFRYVCKYLIKQNFNFENLATIDFHRGYFKSMQYVFENADTLFPEQVPITDRRTLEYNWREYIKEFSPFVVCSRRPAIGLAYFERNKARFEEGDFKLFGLSKECTTFPRYFVRKTKESLCDVVAYSPISEKPTTCSTISTVVSLLRWIYEERLDFTRFGSSAENSWYIVNNKFLKRSIRDACLEISKFHVYDKKNMIFFQFNGYYYTLWQKVSNKLGFVRLRTMDIIEACEIFESRFEKYYLKYVRPMHYRRVMTEKELYETIENSFIGRNFKEKQDAFYDKVYDYYHQELDAIYKRNLLMQNSKTTL